MVTKADFTSSFRLKLVTGQELASLRGGGNQQVREQVAEAQWHADLALQHNEQVNQHRLAEWQQVERRKEELEEELLDSLTRVLLLWAVFQSRMSHEDLHMLLVYMIIYHES